MKLHASRALLLGAIGLIALAPLGCSTDTPHKAGTGASFKGPVGLQLYSLRALFTKNVPTTLDTVRGFGIRDVELAGTYNMPPAQFRTLLLEKGLNPVSAHFPY